MNFFLIISSIFFSSALLAQRIDPNTTLIAVEVTGQDEEIVKDIGQSDPNFPDYALVVTEYKKAKLQRMIDRFLEQRKIPRSKLKTYKDGAKQGFEVFDPKYKYIARYVMEPVVIEKSPPPVTEAQLVELYSEVLGEFKSESLSPYVFAAGLDSGGGHYNIGGVTADKNPFFIHPNLLRNLFVYFHNHPSLIYGFSDLYDVGIGSSVENFHTQLDGEEILRATVNQFDRWYKSTEDKKFGLQQFLRRMNVFGFRKISNPFGHDRHISLEKMTLYRDNESESDLQVPGHHVVEFRQFRSPRSAEEVKALYSGLIKPILEKLSEPGYLEPMQNFSWEESRRMYTPSIIEADWQKVRKELNLNDPIVNQVIGETLSALRAKKFNDPFKLGGELNYAMTERTRAGSAFEYRIPVKDVDEPNPKTILNGRDLTFEMIEISGKKYWVAYVDAFLFGIDPKELTQTGKVLLNPNECWKIRADHFPRPKISL